MSAPKKGERAGAPNLGKRGKGKERFTLGKKRGKKPKYW